jgi:hypothetical protein
MKTKTGYAEFKADVSALAGAAWKWSKPILGFIGILVIAAAVAAVIFGGILAIAKATHDRAHRMDRDALEKLVDLATIQAADLRLLERRIKQSEPLIDWSGGLIITNYTATNNLLHAWTWEDAR